MKISYNWLRDYINTDLSAPELSTILTDIGLEVEGLEQQQTIRGGLQGLVVAHVLTCQKHPDSDHLHITTLDTGSETVQVVCGAPNVAEGQKVILATVGATLYPTDTSEGFKIKRSKIRGVESLGMICAQDEIGVGTSHEGIIVLPDDAPVGAPAASMFDLNDDYLFEIGLTPNRVDGASHYGVARDVAAYLHSKGDKTHAYLPTVPEIKGSNTKNISVQVVDTAAAPRYMGVVMDNITIAPSPEWLQTKLRAVGLNPHNNVVDITNFILHECGQPMHCFDLDKIEGNQIIVKKCEQGTPFTTLDGVERKLSADDLMICSQRRPLCMAGVFGGQDSGVSDTTTAVFIESAYFDPATIRGAAKRHGLSTDSSFRYERGADPQMPPYALKRCVQLLEQLAGAKVASEVVDIYAQKIAPFTFDIDLDGINALIGKQLPHEQMLNILEGLQIKTTPKGGALYTVSVPTFRVDVQRQADIAEEILRIYGYNNIENPHFIKNVITTGNQRTADKMIAAISDMLSALGCNEIMSNSLTKGAYYEHLTQLPIDRCVKILNPLSSDLNVMRQSLLFNALEAVELNTNRRRADLKLYEFGKCYHLDNQAGEGLKAYREQMRLGIAVTGLATAQSWNNVAKNSDIFTLKTLVERILERLGIDINQGRWQSSDNELFNQGATYTLRGGELLTMGRVDKKINAIFDLKAPVFYAEINVEKLHKIAQTVRVSVDELSKYQSVKRDLALLVDHNITFEQLRDLACKAEKKLLTNVTLFDVYQGDKLPDGKKSYALSFTLEDKAKTLSDSDIERSMANILSSLERNASASLRS